MPRTGQHVVRLNPSDRRRLTRRTRAGKHPARAVTHARILLKADQADGGPGRGGAAIAAALGCGARTVARVRTAFADGGLDPAVHRERPTGRRFRTLAGEQEARLVALACAPAPGGRARRAMRLRADRPVELRVVDAVSGETVRRTPKRPGSSPGSSSSG